MTTETIVRGSLIGRQDSARFILATCVDCGLGHWVRVDRKDTRPRCRSCAQRRVKWGPDNPLWNGGTGYKSRNRLARYIMEKVLGRKLTASEVVHHKNRDPLDNRIENLQLFPSSVEHAKWHYEHGDCRLNNAPVCGGTGWKELLCPTTG